MMLGDLLFSILEKQKTVVIPRFGIVVEKSEGAKIISGNVIPPSASYSFTCNNVDDDGVLVSNWARINNISYNEARLDINKQIKELSIELFEKRHAHIAGFASFSLTEDNKTEFAIDKSVLEVEDFIDKPIAISSARKKNNKVIVEAEKKKEKKEKKSNSKESRKLFIFLGIMFLLGALVVGWFSIPRSTRDTYFQKVKLSLTSFESNSEFAEVSDNDVVVDSVDTVLLDTIVADTLGSLDSVGVPELGDNELYTLEMSGYEYFVIAGQFSLRSNAENLYWSLKDKGYTPIFLGRRSGLYQVAIGGFKKRFSADSLELTLRSSEELKSCWVLDINNNSGN
ncbi:MAG: SPOR domain-containing protein [Bacteroidales bacterium]